jgi:hypothetical protein
MSAEDIGIEYLDESAPRTGYEEIMMIVDIEYFAYARTAHADFLRAAFTVTAAAAVELADH